VPAEILAESGIVSGNPEQAAAALSALAAKDEQNKGLQRILELGTIDDPTLLFSKGQLQWDLMNQSTVADGSIQPSDAALSWKDALDAQENWIDAQVALGFAYYEQRQFEAAIDIWEQALTGENYDIPVVVLHDQGRGAEVQRAPMELHAQLGLAMAYYQESKIGLTEADQLPLLAAAADHWQDFLEIAEAAEVNTGDMSFHWLWSQQALADLNEARTNIETYISKAN
jgi:tetratricopeptide (TPR) repeat protein